MRGRHCLFSAPFSFLPEELRERYRALMPTTFREIWDGGEVEPDPTLTAWVVNPGQRFLVDDGILARYPGLEVLVTPSTGRNHLDAGACARRGVAVYSLLDDREGLETVAASAEFTFLLLLNTLRRLDLAVREVSARRWRDREDLMRGHELSGKQVGLVGLGRIGRRLARYCRAFEAEVRYYDPYVKSEEFVSCSLAELFGDSDIVCVCCGLTQETRGMIDGSLLRRLKRGACLINTSRGEVIAEEDLVEILRTRDDLRVSLDVLAGEVGNVHLRSPLVSLHDEGRVVVTPHIAGATVESQTKAASIVLGLLRQHFACRS